MKKFAILLVAVTLILPFCKQTAVEEKRPMLFYHTPYEAIPEMLMGRVKQVTEKNFWAVPDGDSWKKGNPITLKDRDSVNWTKDFVVLFDEQGDMISCTLTDENGNSLQKDELSKENGLITSARLTLRDTLRSYEKWSYDKSGRISEVNIFNANTDTLAYINRVLYSRGKDTVTYQIFSSRNVPGGRWIFLYDNTGKCIQSSYYNRNNECVGGQKIKYNDREKMSELVIFGGDNSIKGSNFFTYEYDDKGNWTKAVVKDDMERHYIEERTYTYFE